MLSVPRAFTDAPNPFPSGSNGTNFANPIGTSNIIKLGFEYRVQFYLQDSLNPWWDGRIVDYDPEDFDSQDREQITMTLEGWQTRLGFAVLTESVNPGIQPNGVNNGSINADTYLLHLIGLYQDSATFGNAYVSPIPIVLDKMNFDGAELSKAIDDIVKQVQDNTANTFEWWIRGINGGKPAIVIQPNQNPNKVSTGYTAPDGVLRPVTFQYEYKNSTIKSYKVTNSSRSLFNNIALYGGKDPTTNVQIYQAFKDSTSISLYGIRQKKVTKSDLLSSTSLANYATVYLLLNGYPQPQGTFKKVRASDAVRAGKWFQIHEPSTGKGNQAIKQMRCLKTTISVAGGDKMEQFVTVAAPRPYIDQAFYAAIASAANALSLNTSAFVSSANNQYFIFKGFEWRSNLTANTPIFTAPYGEFSALVSGSRSGGTTTLSTLQPNDSYGNVQYSIVLADSVTAATGDGYYEVVFALNPSVSFGLAITTPDLVCIKGKVSANSGILKGWAFTVAAGVIIGAIDQRIVGSAKMAAGTQQNYPAPTFSTVATSDPAVPYAPGVSGALGVHITITNVPQDGIVGKVVWYIKLAGRPVAEWASWAETSLQGMPIPPTTQNESLIFGGVSNGASYDIGLAYVTTAGVASPNIATISPVGGFTPGVMGIATGYLIGGISYTPLLVNATATLSPSANGISADITVGFDVSNQPTDGGLSRISYWFRRNGTTVWSFYASLPAYGVGTLPPSASPPTGIYSGTHAFVYADLVGGNSYDFGMTLENAQGGEAPSSGGLAVPVSPPSLTNIAATVIAIPGATVMPPGFQANGPTITAASFGVAVAIGGASVNQPFTFSIGDWLINAQPTWFAGFQFYGRIHLDNNAVAAGSIPASGQVTNITAAESFGPGATYDVGIAFIGGTGDQSVIVWDARLANLTPALLQGPIAVAGANNGNYIPDAQLAHRTAAGIEPYWPSYLIDGNAFSCTVGNNSQPFNLFSWKNGANGTVRYANSQGFTLPVGIVTLTAYIDLINASSGSGGVRLVGPMVNPVSNTNPSANPPQTGVGNDQVVASILINTPVAVGIIRSTTFNISAAGVYCLQASNKGIVVGGSPIFMGMFQVESGPTFSGFKPSTPVQTQGANTGLNSYLASASQFQTGIDINGNPVYGDGATINSLRPGQIGADQTRFNTSDNTNNVGNTSSGVVSLSTSGGQVNMVADSDIAFSTGTNTYWIIQNGWFTNAFSGQNRYYYDYPANATRAGENSWATNYTAINYACNGTQSYVASVNIATDGLPSGNFSMVIMNANNSLEIGRIQVNAGSGLSRRSASFTAPAGCTAVALLFQINVPTGGAANHYACTAGQFQIENGTTPTGYKPNLKQHSQGYLERGAHHPSITGAIGPDGKVVQGSNSTSVIAAVAGNGSLIGVGSTAFITGTSGPANQPGSGNMLALNLNIPSIGGAQWYVEVIFNAPGTNVRTDIQPSGAAANLVAVSGFSGGTYGVDNQSTGIATAMGTTAGGMLSFLIVASRESIAGNNTAFNLFGGNGSAKATRYS